MLNRADSNATLAIDTQNLAQLRSLAKHAPDQALKAAAQQFESVFLNMMLKSMREATPQDGLFESEQTKLFTGMLDQQLAQNMSSRGVGLADILVKQLTRSNAAVQSINGANLIGNEVKVSSSAGNVQQDFVKQMLPHALQASQASGVPAQLMLGQAALESGWGKHEIRMADGSNSHNLFGIKANASWTGQVAEVTTTEYSNGIASKQIEKFRAYGSYAEAFKDYASLLSQNPRYAAVLQQNGDAAGMAQALQNAGYATGPQYADKLTRVMQSIRTELHGAA
jgi:flagellar protein FlgJ